ncbi:MAG: cysteine--tRNA ligase, partial [Alphaproteobacteria bacterium]
VHDLAHVGNARPAVVFDVLYRLLRHIYGRYHVTFARNFTDIDDKIIARAERTGRTVDDITSEAIDAYRQDMTAVGVLPPDLEPRATDHLPQMVAMIERLLATKHAYVADGHVLFAVPSMSDYGRLSGHNRDALIAGARVEVAPYKRDPADFVLWKPSSPDQPGWDSPWGRGRPGWHLECSAMIEAHLGDTIDIHGGGQDLIFPHHENEIAQSCCAHGGAPFVRTWMHVGFLQSSGEKMSKSLGNIDIVRDLLATAPAEAIRHAILATHYRQPIDFGPETLAQSRAALDALYQPLRGRATGPSSAALARHADPRVQAALEDDLNTPLAFSLLHDLAHAVNRAADDAAGEAAARRLKASADLLGLLQDDPEAWFRWHPPAEQAGLDDAEIVRLIARRRDLRLARDFAGADRVRDGLLKHGVLLEDSDGETRWRRAGTGEV